MAGKSLQQCTRTFGSKPLLISYKMNEDIWIQTYPDLLKNERGRLDQKPLLISYKMNEDVWIQTSPDLRQDERGRLDPTYTHADKESK